jgi:hypothetical protein
MATSKKGTKKSSVKNKAHKTSKSNNFQDFKLAKENAPFISFKLTQQTFYWLMLLLLIFALAIWVLDLQLQTNAILTSIEISLR